MFRGYSVYSSFTLIKDLILTEILYPRCRIIRFPFYTKNEKNICFGKNFTAGRGNRIDVVSTNSDKNIIIFGDRRKCHDT